MKPLQALVVDDEPLALRRLALTLKEIGGVEVVDTTTSARQAIELIGNIAPDLVFLDIAMPGLSGFDVIARLSPERMPAIIFVTAYDRHAVRAFGADAVDYLLKPVAPERLEAAVQRARIWLNGRAGPAAGSRDPAMPRFLTDDDSLWVHRHREFVRVPVSEIEWIEAYGDYVRLHARGGGGLLRMTLAALEAQLDPQDFVRVHRSAICRRSAIVSLKRKQTGALTVYLSNGDRAPVGRTFGAGLRALLRKVREEQAAPSSQE
jgi:DNA-binding LytR/AlgR family response regulator